MDAPSPGGVGGTFVGNPVAHAAALAVLDVIEDEGLVERSAAIGETMRLRMESWQERWPQVGDVRGLGGMLAIELVWPRQGAGDRARLAGRRRGARARPAAPAGRRAGNCIRVLVPLVISDAQLDEALDVWEALWKPSCRRTGRG